MAPASLAEDALRLDAVLPDPVGLAHDAVSRRFIVGDRRLNSLVVVDEVFNRITNMVAAASAGFFGLTGFEIDRARGDLWVANSSRDGGASLHKLQLISGRVLYSVQLPDDAGPADFRDIAVTPGGTVTVLDASGSRILRLRPGRRAFEAPAPVDLEDPTSLAAPDEQAAYVAHRGGLARVSVADGATTPLDAAPGIDLRGLRRIWSFNGSLVALQAHGSTTRIVRIALGGGGARALRLRVLDPDAAIVNETMATLGQADLYYVTQRDGRNVVRRLRLN
jgi:hypothetical protein